MVESLVSGQGRRVHFVIGPTGVGKTAKAHALALSTGAPVVVADRIQCFVDLATTSARLDDDDQPGVHRYWLPSRTVPDGDYPSEQAARDLTEKLLELTERNPFVIVEGGSISLVRDFTVPRRELPFEWTVQTLHIGDRRQYLNGLTRRARRMLTPSDARLSMLDELTAAWRHRNQRFFVASVNGFEAILEWCAKYGVDQSDLSSGRVPDHQLARLAELVARRHAEHGFLQEQVFTEMFDQPVGTGSAS